MPTKLNNMNQYESVFILNPVLSESQIEEAVQKYVKLIKDQKGKFQIKRIGVLKN